MAVDLFAYRGRNDDGNETTATWKAAQNTPWAQSFDVNFRVRFKHQNDTGALNNLDVRLQYNLNGAGWNDVTAASNVVRSSASANLADQANLTTQLTGGTGTFIGLTAFDEANGICGGNSLDVTATGNFETEFCVQLRSADCVVGDTVELRTINSDTGTAWGTYTVVASMHAGQRSMAADSGSYAITGSPIDLTYAAIAFQPGAFQTDAFQTADAVVNQYTLEADSGSYAITGTATGLRASYLLAAAAGSYAVTGQNVTLALVRKLIAESGGYALSGQTAALLKDSLIGAGPGSYTITGTAAELRKGFVMLADTGAYSITGQAATLLADRLLSAASGIYQITGTAAGLNRTFVIVADAGAYIVTGENAATLATRALQAGAGVYEITGQAAALQHLLNAAEIGSVTLADALAHVLTMTETRIGGSATLSDQKVGDLTVTETPLDS